jgi:4-hydroxy-tetrahydrodipicolinate synthase
MPSTVSADLSPAPFGRVLTAMATPFTDDGAVDLDAAARLATHLVEHGHDGIVVSGTTGESPTTDDAEQVALLRAVLEAVGHRAQVVAGVGTNDTRHSIELARTAEHIGAHGLLVVTPYYNKPPQEGLYQHFKAVAEAVDIPQILYNVPGRTACDMLPSTVERLAAVPNIVGLKEALGDLDRVRDLVALGLEDFALYSGDDATARASMLAGFHGDISVTANVAPEAMARMCAAALAGDDEAAAAIDADLAGLHRALFAEPNPIPVKWALAEIGLIPGGIRLPLVELDEMHHEDVRAALRAAGLL